MQQRARKIRASCKAIFLEIGAGKIMGSLGTGLNPVGRRNPQDKRMGGSSAAEGCLFRQARVPGTSARAAAVPPSVKTLQRPTKRPPAILSSQYCQQLPFFDCRDVSDLCDTFWLWVVGWVRNDVL